MAWNNTSAGPPTTGAYGAWNTNFSLDDDEESSLRPARVPAVPTAFASAWSSSPTPEVYSKLPGPDKTATAANAWPLQNTPAQAPEAIQVEQTASQASTAKNWPMCYPFLRHDIGSDIPELQRSLVRMGYTTWLLSFAGLLWNLLIISILWSDNQASVMNWVAAFLLFLVGVPVTFVLWYRRLYFTAQLGGSWAFVSLLMLLNIAMSAWIIVGPPASGYYLAGIMLVSNKLQNEHTTTAKWLTMVTVFNILAWAGVMGLSWAIMAKTIARCRGKSTEAARDGSGPAGRLMQPSTV